MPIGDQVPARGNRLSRMLGRTALRLSGWRVEGALPNLPKFVIIAAPHTSNFDFPLGVLCLFAVGFHAHWLGKASLFRWPVAGILRWLGGVPVDRFQAHGMVEQIVAEMSAADRFIVALAPEGTRRKVPAWRTGFYHVAQGAGVPIVLGFFDYRRKVVGFGPSIMPTGDLERDLAEMRTFYDGITARHPDQF